MFVLSLSGKNILPMASSSSPLLQSQLHLLPSLILRLVERRDERTGSNVRGKGERGKEEAVKRMCLQRESERNKQTKRRIRDGVGIGKSTRKREKGEKKKGRAKDEERIAQNEETCESERKERA